MNSTFSQIVGHYTVNASEFVFQPGWIHPLRTTLACTLIIAVASYMSIEMPTNASQPNQYHPLFDPTDRDLAATPAIRFPLHSKAPLITAIVLLAMKRFNKMKYAPWVMYYTVFTRCWLTAVQSLGNAASRKIARWTGVQPSALNPRYKLTLSPFRPSLDTIEPQEQISNNTFTLWDVLSFFIMIGTIGLKIKYGSSMIVSDLVSVPVVIYLISRLSFPTFPVALGYLAICIELELVAMYGAAMSPPPAPDSGGNVGPGNSTSLWDLLRVQIPWKNDYILWMSPIPIVVSGLLASLCLQFDLRNFHHSHPNTEFHHLQGYNKPYFTTALLMHSVGFLIPLRVAAIKNVDFPHLLFEIVAMLSGIVVVAMYRGELSKFWNYRPEDVPKKEMTIICSKETLLLAGKELDDESDEWDEDWTPDEDDNEE